MLQPRNTNLLKRAKELRKNMTPQERKLWYLFLAKYPVRFQRQVVIKSFIADFYCAKALLVIEIDGDQHYTDDGLAYDNERTGILMSLGLEVIRFHNDNVEGNFADVCKKIEEAIKTRTGLLERRRMDYHNNKMG